MIPPINVLLPKAYWDWAGQNPADGRYAPEGHISTLATNEVFVFGSNRSGFHGAGSAGWAYCGRKGNQYREGNPLLRAPDGTRGFWAGPGEPAASKRGIKDEATRSAPSNDPARSDP